MAFKKAGFELFFVSAVSTNLSSFTTDSSRELDVLRHDCNSLGMDRAQFGVFEQADQVALTGFLQGHDCCALQSQISLEVLSDFTDKSLERQLSDQQLSWLLISSDFSQSDCSWSVSVRFFSHHQLKERSFLLPSLPVAFGELYHQYSLLQFASFVPSLVVFFKIVSACGS